MNDPIVGKFGEQLATEFLVKKGYKILERNFNSRYGEIDIIAQKDKSLVFVEVKTRVGTKFGIPYEAVRFHKLKHLQKAAQYYLILNKYPTLNYRYDVLSIILNRNNEVEKIQHFENIIM